MTGIKFNDENHTYWDGGRQIPSVTQILDSVGFIDKTWYTEESCIRGRYVHKMVHLFNQDRLDMNTVDPSLMGYLDAYKAFRKQANFIYEWSEKIVYNKELGYCGTFDLFGCLNGSDAILDIKTGSIPSWVGYQLSGYKMALVGAKYVKRFSLLLEPHGRYKLNPHTKISDEFVFTSANTVYQAKAGLV